MANSTTTALMGPRGNQIDPKGCSAMVCRTMANFCRSLSRRFDISEDQALDQLEQAELWEAAAKEHRS